MKTRFALFCSVAVCSLGLAQANQNVGKILPYNPKPDAPVPTFSSALVGGSDNCATADVISGNGTFAVNNTGATNSVPIGSCGAMTRDVWFRWTATASGDLTVSACGGVTGTDTVLAIWADNGGACPTTQIACNDDFCGLISQLTLTGVTNGTTYMIEWGCYSTAQPTYNGTFTISVTPPPVPPVNDDCASPIAISGSGLFPFDNRAATTGTQGQAEAACNFYSQTGIGNDAWWTWTPSKSGAVTLTTCGYTNPVASDTKVAIYDGTGCPVAAAIACNDDEGYPGTLTCASYVYNSTVTWNAVCGQTYTIQLGRYPFSTTAIQGQFSINETGTTCAPPPVGYCFGDGSATACPCGNAGATGNGCANSLNANGANLSASGTSSISADTLVLNGTGMPNSSCLYFQGDNQVNSGMGVVFGDGLRCAGTNVRRLGTKINSGGASSYPVGADPSISVRGAVTAPGVKRYQAWYRNADPAFCTPSTFNLSNGLEVTWF